MIWKKRKKKSENLKIIINKINMSDYIDLISLKLDYKTKRYSRSQPLYAKVNPQSGGTFSFPLWYHPQLDL